MQTENEIAQAMQRTKRYWYDDGLAEIAAGAIFFLVGLLFLLESASVIAAGVSSIGVVVVVLAGMWLSRRLVTVAKERFTYPRTGYVSYQRGGRLRKRWATAIVAATMGALVAVLLATAPATLALIPALQGILIAASFLYWGHNFGMNRFYALALCSALFGAAATLAGLGDLAGSAAYFVAMGLALVAGGVFALRAYARVTIPLGEQE